MGQASEDDYEHYLDSDEFSSDEFGMDMENRQDWLNIISGISKASNNNYTVYYDRKTPSSEEPPQCCECRGDLIRLYGRYICPNCYIGKIEESEDM